MKNWIRCRVSHFSRFLREVEYSLASSLMAVTILVIVPTRGLLGSQAENRSQDALKQHYDAAAAYQQAKDQEHAAAEYKAFLAEALHRIANGEAQTGQFAAAFPLFAEALEFAPQEAQLRIDYATASFDAEKLLQAKIVAEPAAQSSPGNAQVRLLLGRILFQLGEYSRAREELEAAVAANPDFNTGYLLGRTYLLLHEEKRARVLFDEMVAGLGNTPLIHIYFGKAYSLMDYPDQAVEEFKQAIALDAHAPDAHYYLALAQMRHDESAGYSKAIPELRSELAINPNDVRSHYMLGYIAQKQHNLAEAETELGQASALQPNDANTLVNLAEVYTGQNRFTDAEAVFRKAIKLAQSDPQNANQAGRAHYLLGRLLMKTGREDEARQEIRISAELDNPAAVSSGLNAEARVISSSSMAQQQDSEERAARPAPKTVSQEELRRLEDFKNQLSPAIAQAYSELAAVAVNRQDFRTAVSFLQKAAVWNPALPGLDRSLGMAAFYAKEYDLAVKPLERHLASHPEDSAARSAYDQALKQQTSTENAPRPN